MGLGSDQALPLFLFKTYSSLSTNWQALSCCSSSKHLQMALPVTAHKAATLNSPVRWAATETLLQGWYCKQRVLNPEHWLLTAM